MWNRFPILKKLLIDSLFISLVDSNYLSRFKSGDKSLIKHNSWTDRARKQRCTGSWFQESNPAGFSTFWTNRIGSGYGLIQVSGSGSGFSNLIFFRFDANTIIKKFWQRVKGCNMVYINFRCAKDALLHQTCHTLQGASLPQHAISPLSGSVEPRNTAWYQITL